MKINNLIVTVFDDLGTELNFTCPNKEELNKTASTKENDSIDSIEYPIPDFKLSEDTISKLCRMYKVLQHHDNRDSVELCNLARALYHGDISDLLCKLHSNLHSKSTLTLAYKMLRIPHNAGKLAPYEFQQFHYELRMCWLRALITGNPYQILQVELTYSKRITP